MKSPNRRAGAGAASDGPSLVVIESTVRLGVITAPDAPTSRSTGSLRKPRHEEMTFMDWKLELMVSLAIGQTHAGLLHPG